MKRLVVAILGLRNAKAPMRRGRREQSDHPGGPDAAGAKRKEKGSGGEAPPSSQVSSGTGRRFRSRSLCGRLDRLVQTDAQAEPARPDGGTASGASVASLERDRAAVPLEVFVRTCMPVGPVTATCCGNGSSGTASPSSR